MVLMHLNLFQTIAARIKNLKKYRKKFVFLFGRICMWADVFVALVMHLLPIENVPVRPRQTRANNKYGFYYLNRKITLRFMYHHKKKRQYEIINIKT